MQQTLATQIAESLEKTTIKSVRGWRSSPRRWMREKIRDETPQIVIPGEGVLLGGETENGSSMWKKGGGDIGITRSMGAMMVVMETGMMKCTKAVFRADEVGRLKNLTCSFFRYESGRLDFESGAIFLFLQDSSRRSKWRRQLFPWIERHYYGSNGKIVVDPSFDGRR